VDAIVDVLATKAQRALEATGLKRLVVAGGVGANAQLRTAARGCTAVRSTVHFPPVELCTDNGAMIAPRRTGSAASFGHATSYGALSFGVRPRWTLAEAMA
jgi:N6-L-threonylcarbamoyladenine synthase